MQNASNLLSHPDKVFIAGKWQSPSTDARISVISPSTETLLMQVADAQEQDINRAVASARFAFDEGPWPRLTHKERAEYLKGIAAGMRARSSTLSMIWSSEVGLVKALGDAVVPSLGSVYDYYASLADTFPFVERHKPAAGGNEGLLVREPVGVVAAIIPWNAPAMTVAYKVAPALLAGCTVIVKASPEAPGALYLLAEIVDSLQLPPGVFNVVAADREVSEKLVRHPGVDKVTFTGSSAAGKIIGSICASRVARCTLELGGKSAAVMREDYDPEKLAAVLSGSIRVMCGQICSSITRVVVPESRHDVVVEALHSEFKKIRVGDPFDTATDMGPLATKRHRDRVEGYIKKGEAEGATLASGGRRPRDLGRGFYVEPTVFGNVANTMSIAREEIFGPVISVIPSKDDGNAVDIANDSDFGLNASVFTNDIEEAYKIARRLRCGTVGHNAFRTDFSIAFGGFKQSGIGREGGTEGLLPFLEAKTVILDALPSELVALHAPKK
jgi:aldehyde dehydrogenase (NAD+)